MVQKLLLECGVPSARPRSAIEVTVIRLGLEDLEGTKAEKVACNAADNCTALIDYT